MSKQWDPTKLTVSAGGIPLNGFGDGVMFSAAYEGDQHSASRGSDGKSRHVKNPDKTALFTIRTKMGSAANGILQGFVNTDLPIPIIATDGTAVAAVTESLSCKIRKVPAWERADVESVLDWVWQALDAEIQHSGAKD
jgi:hypothetical protein